MKTNKLDNNIKEKLQNRTFQPSASAWERLSTQLDEQPKQKKRGWFFYIGAAASVLLLVSIGIQLFSDDSEEIIPKNEIIVDTPIDTSTIDKKIEQFINEIPTEKALVKVDENIDVKKEVVSIKESESHPKKKRGVIAKKEEKIIIAKIDEKEISIDKITSEKNTSVIKKEALQQNPNSRIKINSDDLLYAVTHTPKEVKNYYAKYNVNREDVLRTIKSELKKSNIKINPNTILAEVERTIDDDDFQNNFMKSLKRKVSDIATAIASRNE
jgi:hypothetical protein